MKAVLLTRGDFRESVFARDQGLCVHCKVNPAVDAHHIIERRLWPDGGYYLDNGASVCSECHLLCEMTLITVEQIRIDAGITSICLPPDFYSDTLYDKWGNPILSNRLRAKGPLFYEETVQKILKRGGVLSLFTNYVKYPRTHHLPFSPGIHSDDRVIEDTSRLEAKEIVVTEKMDGENTTIYNDYFHARSVESRSHPSQDLAKALAARFQHDLPRGWRVCCENLYAQHSIRYENLPSCLLGFSIWNDTNYCLDWDSTIEWFQMLGILPVRELYRGPYDEKLLRSLPKDKDWDTSEGFVVRTVEGFCLNEFKHCVAKYVRRGHVQTNKHWKYGQRVVPNGFSS